MNNKSKQTRIGRDWFVLKYSLDTLRALAAIRQAQQGATVNSPFSKKSLATYKANLNRGAYQPFVGPNFRNDKLNLKTCNR